MCIVLIQKRDIIVRSAIFISTYVYFSFLFHSYRNGGVMVSVFVSSVVDREFESRLGQTKD